MAYTVTISKQLSITADPVLQPAAVRLVVTVTGVTDFVDQGIFLFAIDPVTNQLEYSGVASPSDLQNIPYNTVNILNIFVRRNAIDLVYPSGYEADAAIDSIENDIQALCQSMTALTALQTPVVTVIGV